MTLYRGLAGLLLVALFILTSTIRAQPDEKLIDELWKLSKTPREPIPKMNRLRELLTERYNVSLDELAERCKDFRQNTASKAMVVEAAKEALNAELELRETSAEKEKVLAKAISLLQWYEKQLKDAKKAGLVPEAEVLRVQYRLLTLQIDLEKLKEPAPAAKKD